MGDLIDAIVSGALVEGLIAAIERHPVLFFSLLIGTVAAIVYFIG